LISQPKIELAVLYKLHQHAEAGGEPIPPVDVAGLFGIQISNRRIELALEELEQRGEVQRGYDRMYLDEGVWTISRVGLTRIDRALRVPVSFVARLNSETDAWLESDEAKSAVLKSLPKAVPSAAPMPAATQLPSVTINNQMSPSQTVNVSQPSGAPNPHAKSSATAGWTNVWIGVVTGLIAIAGLVFAILSWTK
jgi:hypothetical protein